MSNPAQRLHDLLLAGSKKDRNQASIAVWSELLAFDPKDRKQFFQKIHKVMDIPSEVSELIGRQNSIDPQLALKWMPAIERAFSSISPDGSFEPFAKHISQTVIYSLELCASTLEKHFPEEDLDDDELLSLQHDIDEIRETILRAEIDREIKRYLLGLVNKLSDAVTECRILGPNPIKAEIREFLGRVVTESTLFKKTQKTPLGKRVFNLFKDAAVLVGLTNNLLTLSEKILPVLPESSGSSDVEILCSEGESDLATPPPN